ncbi:MAG: hypothetical protein K9W45_06735 [Candidatus Heimdallarchaeum aukensis]|uniref:Uncharacterized protein n=1 Tax=Candidatus Heimdallarchaeum aukensis TaxID=2876573 RepID=A0A9Y1BIL2_9ARCH|nr:MAG: hypothetical protein K9W45_06735 [Candidatus Heimdallarchaeum aukensis]
MQNSKYNKYHSVLIIDDIVIVTYFMSDILVLKHLKRCEELLETQLELFYLLIQIVTI